ncbi:MAG: ribosome maturation factor RimM [Allobaculum sp.]
MIRIARIINTRGLKGECKLDLYTDQPEVRFEKGNTLYLEEKTPLTVVKYSEYKGFGYAMFEEITSIEQAETLKNKTLYLPEEELGELEDEDEFYYSQLQGCTVYNQNNENIGKVVDILETGANLVLRVQEKDKSYLLPFVKAHVKSVDPETKTIVIEEMAGLR